MPLNPLQSLLKHTFLGPALGDSYLMDLGWRVPGVYIYDNSKVMRMLLVQGPHCENHPAESIDTQSWQLIHSKLFFFF